MRHRTLVLSILFISPFVLFGQTYHQFKKAAQQSFDQAAYEEALAYNLVLLQEFNRDSSATLLAAGRAALELRAFDLSACFFSQIEESNQSYDTAHVYFLKAQMAHMKGRYEEAIGLYERARTKGMSQSKEIQTRVKECQTDLEQSQYRTDAQVERMKNNIAFASSYMNTVYDDSLYYSTFQFGANKKTLSADSFIDCRDSAFMDSLLACNCFQQSPCSSQLNVYSSDLNGATTASLWGENSSHVSFSENGLTMYYTVCSCKNDEYDCQIYSRSRIRKDTLWGRPKALPAPINLDGSTSTQPHVGIDPTSGQACLYFVSNRDTSSKMDIYMAFESYPGKGLTTCKKLDIDGINSQADEMSPFFHQETNRLFFSSNRSNGIGYKDFDVYYYRFLDPEKDTCQILDMPIAFDTVMNAGLPINSINDDLFFRMDTKGETGYLSSNRESADTCNLVLQSRCLDLFRVDMNIPEEQRSIIVELACSCPDWEYRNSMEHAAFLDGLKVYLVDTAGVQIDNGELIPNSTNFRFNGLSAEMEYQAVVEKYDFEDQQSGYYAPSYCIDDTTSIALVLTPKIEWKIYTRDKNYPSRHINAGPLFIKKNGVEIGTVDFDTQGQFYKAVLEPCSTYDVFLKEEHLDVLPCGLSIDPGKLSKRRAASCQNVTMVDSIFFKTNIEGLFLYFDDSRPYPREAALAYDNFYYEYTDSTRLSDYFKSNEQYACAGGIDSIQQFFEHKVVESFNRLKEFACYVNGLSTDERVAFERLDLGMTGHASRTGNRLYNEALSRRRVRSVELFLNSLFVSEVRTKINFTERKGFGFEKADPPERFPCSVFGKNQSDDRKIEITYFKINASEQMD